MNIYIKVHGTTIKRVVLNLNYIIRTVLYLIWKPKGKDQAKS